MMGFRIMSSSLFVFLLGDRGDFSRHPESGGVPSDCGGAGAGGQLLCFQQPGGAGAPQDFHRRPGRALLPAASALGGKNLLLCFH